MRHGSELMGAGRRTEVIMKDKNRQLEGRTKTRHRTENPKAPEGARSTIPKNCQFEEKRMDNDSEGRGMPVKWGVACFKCIRSVTYHLPIRG